MLPIDAGSHERIIESCGRVVGWARSKQETEKEKKVKKENKLNLINDNTLHINKKIQIPLASRLLFAGHCNDHISDSDSGPWQSRGASCADAA